MEIIFEGYGKKAKLVEGRTILSYLQEFGIDIDASCGGKGVCGNCQVMIERGSGVLSRKTERENKLVPDEDYRLACQAIISGTGSPLYVHVPEREYDIMVSGEVMETPLEPLVRRKNDRVFYRSKDIGEYTGKIYGIALDIGTTTLAMHLIDLETGQECSVISRENPQIKYGNNVISRIEFAKTGQGKLEEEIRNATSEMIGNVTDPDKIYEIVVVGNPVMRDLFFGYSVESLGKSPFESLSKEAVNKTAKELGLKPYREARVYGLPLIGGFVGADALAVVLGTEMYKSGEINLAIDFGTNTEIILGNKDRLIATSCAAGPAFEGAKITCGMGGISGAIKEVRIDNGSVMYETIGDAAPIGVCGSGLIDTLSELLDKKIIDGRGKFYGAEKEFTIARGISLSEMDIDQLNLAKSAISVGTKVLMEKYGIELEDVDSVLLAGGFGNFTNTENAINIGLLPEIEPYKVKKVGNAALEGARQALISETKRVEAETIANSIKHVKLEEDEDFMGKFVNEFYFQKYL